MDSVTAAQDDSSGANPSSIKSDDSSPRHEGGRSSPPPKCAICLGICRNKSFTDSCLHQFCFKCLLTWSKVKAECPLCKQNFRSIIHNVRANDQYEEYLVEQRQDGLGDRIDIDLAGATRRFRYRTTFTVPRQDTLALQQLLLQHYGFAAPPPAPARRRSPASFRRTVYRYNLWARPLPDFTGRFRDCSPGFYRYNASQVHRLVPWLSRELHYLLHENAAHVGYVVERVLEALRDHPILSPPFRDAMRRFFGERTDHFLHELHCFATTPYDMAGYDRNVQYTTDGASSAADAARAADSDASADSDVVVVSSSGPPEPPPGPSGAAPPAPPAAPAGVVPIETLSRSDTDDDSEVVVVGYVKPPRERTPEVVDLLGSDSDVVAHEGPARPAPPAPAAAPARRPRPSPVVRLALSRRRSPPAARRKRLRTYRRSSPPSSSSSSCSDLSTPSSDGWDSEPRSRSRTRRRQRRAAAGPSMGRNERTARRYPPCRAEPRLRSVVSAVGARPAPSCAVGAVSARPAASSAVGAVSARPAASSAVGAVGTRPAVSGAAEARPAASGAAEARPAASGAAEARPAASGAAGVVGAASARPAAAGAVGAVGAQTARPARPAASDSDDDLPLNLSVMRAAQRR